ncbi:hypothetical protein ILUMI_18972 [Ignelater luminosus]|uniref:ABC transporter domain-containing protein n=1 Tax=Ignelater luminosus TaxID=2038154 RepID=A0A8K0CLF2_IGNLU|nr:hypothetical protein ILUMI_18972 [Ignelater luminosus]
MDEDPKVKSELYHSEQQIFPQEKKQLAVCVRNASKFYGSKNKPVMVLNGLNMTVPKGIIYGLLGASGCGKTTLLNCIVGRRRLNSGSIWVLGSKDCNIPSSLIGFMPQESNQDSIVFKFCPPFSTLVLEKEFDCEAK